MQVSPKLILAIYALVTLFVAFRVVISNFRAAKTRLSESGISDLARQYLSNNLSNTSWKLFFIGNEADLQKIKKERLKLTINNISIVALWYVSLLLAIYFFDV